jgi:hypothetical protein
VRLPLHAHLVVVELLGLHLLGDRGQRRELVAGAREVGNGVAAVDGHGSDRLVDDPRAGGNEVVHPVERVAVAVVLVREVEAVEAQAADDLQRGRHLELVLEVGRGYVRLHVVVGVGCALAIGHGRADGRVGVGGGKARGSVVEESRLPEIVRALAPQLYPREESVLQSPRDRGEDHVRLVEHVLALRCVVVGREGNAALVRRDRARHVVLVEAVVVAVQGAVA